MQVHTSLILDIVPLATLVFTCTTVQILKTVLENKISDRTVFPWHSNLLVPSSQY